MPVIFVNFTTNALSRSSQHTVLYRLAVQLVPQGSTAPVGSRAHLLQVLADPAENSIRVLNRGRARDSSALNVVLLKGRIEACEKIHDSACATVHDGKAVDFTFRLVDTDNRCVVSTPRWI